ncbi:MAG: caspase family protein [Planctomycetota bacterium]|jgi:hypothetical protein
MGTLGRWIRVAVCVLSVAGIAGCLGAPQPVEQRKEFDALRARVGGTIERPVHVHVEGQPGAIASHSPEEQRLTLPEPSRDLSDRIVGAVTALGAFQSVGNGGGPAPAGALRLDVRCRPNTVTYAGANGWLGVSFTAWSFGLPAAFWVDDEDYHVAGGWEVTLTDTATGRQLARREIPIAKTIGLNDWERGFSLLDVVLYHAAPVDEERLTTVHKLIAPHGEADATLALCEWLVAEAIATLPVPETPVKPGPEPVKPDPEPVKPDPEPVKPDPEPVKPDPEPVKPDPEPVKPDPEPVPPARHAATHVLCIGVEAYASDAAAPFAAADARLVAAALQTAGVDADRVTTLTDGAATKRAIDRWLQARRDDLVDGDHLIVFFAGRGATVQGAPVLLPADATVAAAADAGLALRAVTETLAGAGRVTLLLDCAFQGRLEERGPESDTGPGTPNWLPPNAALIAAAYGSGEATTGAEPNGLFSQHLAAALGAEAGHTTQSLVAALRESVRRQARARGVLETPTAAGADHRITGKDD